MPETELFSIFTGRLQDAGLEYAVTGSVASTLYGEPRLTHDVDIVLAVRSVDASRLSSIFPLDEFYCPPEEVIRAETLRPQRGHFNLIHHASGFKADIYLVGRDLLHHWALRNKRHVTIEGQDLWVAPPEYVIVRKLQFYREGRAEKHLRDIGAMLDVSADIIDHEELSSIVQQQHLEAEWRVATKAQAPATDE